ncbi:hypothetical protein N0V82_001481 [Gnomoniopsis sp. IMI 355080]|nr:hypothetical protein N0V82_001481 [Gnomoniopsis sp. IMI 355080]
MSSSGENWKSLRKRFNPGFAPQHLMTLLSSIVGAVTIFVDQLEDIARSGESFSLQDAATNLTFDVIGKVALDMDIGAQSPRPTEFMRTFRELIETFTGEQIDLPRWCKPRLEWKRRRLAKQIRGMLTDIVQNKYAERSNTSIPARSILAMSLKDMDRLSPTVLDVTCDQLSSFLFAGHDSTGTTIAWTLYELYRTPHALQAVRTELDNLFGTETTQEAIVSRLLAPGGEELIYRMSYTSAVIKETLRLWPPGATARLTKPGDGLRAVVQTGSDTKDLNLDGLMLYNVESIIQRDPAVFGDTANAFVPERWLQQDTADKIPPGAWRAFERGPRNCIGQELALIEARVVIAMVARHYDFVKVGLGAAAIDRTTGKPGLDGHGQYKVDTKIYSTRQVTSKPVDGMEMQVEMAAVKRRDTGLVAGTLQLGTDPLYPKLNITAQAAPNEDKATSVITSAQSNQTCQTTSHLDDSTHACVQNLNSRDKKLDTDIIPDLEIGKSQPKDHDMNIVDWDGPDDPSNPQNCKAYARVTIYHAGNIGSGIFTLACAHSTNINMLIGIRFLAGLIGAVPLAVGAGSIADTLVPAKKDKA